jgi:hypothetical protein
MQCRLEQLRQSQRRDYRFTLIGSAVGMSVAYPLLVAAKLTENLPDQLGWAYVVGWPLVGYGILLGIVKFGSWLDFRRLEKSLSDPEIKS